MILLIVLIINIVLKLYGLLDWSWWGVFWPLWLDLIIFVFAMLKGWADSLPGPTDYF